MFQGKVELRRREGSENGLEDLTKRGICIIKHRYNKSELPLNCRLKGGEKRQEGLLEKGLCIAKA